ncbi:hypothetical protein D3C75_1051460 [compost metagenome]
MQVGATALVADPAGDADVQVEIEVAEQRGAFAGKAMHHRGGQTVTVVLEDRQQALAGITFMEKYRHL